MKYYYTSIRMSKLGLTIPIWGFHVLAIVNSAAINIGVGFPGGSDGKVSACKEEDLGSISGSGRSPGEGNSNLLQYSCLENPMDRGAW